MLSLTSRCLFFKAPPFTQTYNKKQTISNFPCRVKTKHRCKDVTLLVREIVRKYYFLSYACKAKNANFLANLLTRQDVTYTE